VQRAHEKNQIAWMSEIPAAQDKEEAAKSQVAPKSKRKKISYRAIILAYGSMQIRLREGRKNNGTLPRRRLTTFRERELLNRYGRNGTRPSKT